MVAAEDASFFAREGDLTGKVSRMQRCSNLEVGSSNAEAAPSPNSWRKSLLSSERSLLRKAREALITRSLEHHLTKKQILELYLNVAEWGQGVFGAEAAARHHFGKSAEDLTIEDAACSPRSFPLHDDMTPFGTRPHLNRRQRHIVRWLERGAAGNQAPSLDTHRKFGSGSCGGVTASPGATAALPASPTDG